MAEHTPGPWEADGSNVKGANGYSVARINFPAYRGKEGREDRAVCHNNARLIAAAPELLDELIALRRRFHAACACAGSDPEFVAGTTPGADAAIAKARGQ